MSALGIERITEDLVMSSSQATSLAAAPPATAQAMRPAAQESAAVSGASAQATPVKPKIDFDPREMSANLDKAIERLNEQVQHLGRDLSFSRDDQLDRTVVKVTNTRSGEVVRQIPNEVVLRVAHSIEDIKGLLHDGQS